MGPLVKDLLQRPRHGIKCWTGDVAREPRADSPDWWLSSVTGAKLARHGVAVVGGDLPAEGMRMLRQPSPGSDAADGGRG